MLILKHASAEASETRRVGRLRKEVGVQAAHAGTKRAAMLRYSTSLAPLFNAPISSLHKTFPPYQADAVMRRIAGAISSQGPSDTSALAITQKPNGHAENESASGPSAAEVRGITHC
eukprot:3797416-Pleurochrysis_carterae.AAC.2